MIVSRFFSWSDTLWAKTSFQARGRWWEDFTCASEIIVLLDFWFLQIFLRETADLLRYTRWSLPVEDAVAPSPAAPSPAVAGAGAGDAAPPMKRARSSAAGNTTLQKTWVSFAYRSFSAQTWAPMRAAPSPTSALSSATSTNWRTNLSRPSVTSPRRTTFGYARHFVLLRASC